jgi:hypothetical protein
MVGAAILCTGSSMSLHGARGQPYATPHRGFHVCTMQIITAKLCHIDVAPHRCAFNRLPDPVVDVMTQTLAWELAVEPVRQVGMMQATKWPWLVHGMFMMVWNVQQLIITSTNPGTPPWAEGAQVLQASEHVQFKANHSWFKAVEQTTVTADVTQHPASLSHSLSVPTDIAAKPQDHARSIPYSIHLILNKPCCL